MPPEACGRDCRAQGDDSVTRLPQPRFALSLRAPWWWLVLHGHRDVDNTPWNLKHRGPCWLHASNWWGIKEVLGAWEIASRIAALPKADSGVSVNLNAFPIETLEASSGYIVGLIDIVDVGRKGNSPWRMRGGAYGINDPLVLNDPVRCKGGQPGFFEVPDEVLAQLREAGYG